MSPDPNVESIREKLLLRSQIGLKKYGVTTERKDVDLAGWLIHLQQELLDAAVYIEAALHHLQASRSSRPELAPSTTSLDLVMPTAGSTSTRSAPVTSSSLPLEEFLGTVHR